MVSAIATSPAAPAELLTVRRYFESPFAVFVVFLGVYLVTWGGHYTSGDGYYKVSWAKAIYFRGSADIDPGPGLSYSPYGIGHTLIALPAIAASDAVTRVTGIRAEAALYTFTFVLNGAIFIYLVALYLWPSFSPRRVWLTVALLGLATTWWPHTKLDFSEALVATVLLGGFLAVRQRRPLLGGLVAGYALTMRIETVVLLLLLGLYCYSRERRASPLIWFACAQLLWLSVYVAANSVKDVNAVLYDSSSSQAFVNPLAVGVYGILFSAGKSIFLYSPPLILGFFGWRTFYRLGFAEDAILFLSIFVAQLLTYALWWDWSGDDSWGVRFMIPSVMLMSIPLVAILERRYAVIVAASIGIAIQSLAVAVNGLDYVLLLRQQQMVRESLYLGDEAVAVRIDIEDMRYNPQYCQIAGHIILVRTLVGAPPTPRGDIRAARIGTSLYDTLPPEVWRNAARADFVWVRLLSESAVSRPLLPSDHGP